MNQYQDFGFGGAEYEGEITTPPYCQFINSSRFGMGIIAANAELAKFRGGSGWQKVRHEFESGEVHDTYLCENPRMVILNRGKPMMTKGKIVKPYFKEESKGYTAFSYLVAWFLDEYNQPLSKLPFRLRCSGYAGYTLLFNYKYGSNNQSFCQEFLKTYKALTNDRTIEKNEIFYAHAVYQPSFERRKVTSPDDEKTSWAVLTRGYVKPTVDNFGSLIIKNGSSVSDQIKKLMEKTKPWLKTDVLTDEAESQPSKAIAQEKVNESYPIKH